MKKIDLISWLLVLVAVTSGLNFVSNRASFFGVSQTVETIKNKFSGNNFKSLSVGYLDHFNVTCGTSATLVQPEGGASSSIACKCASPVSWGSSTVLSGGYESDNWGGNVRLAYCAAASATVCNCVSLVSEGR